MDKSKELVALFNAEGGKKKTEFTNARKEVCLLLVQVQLFLDVTSNLGKYTEYSFVNIDNRALSNSLSGLPYLP